MYLYTYILLFPLDYVRHICMLLFPPIRLTLIQLYMRACIRACVYASMLTFLHVYMCVFA